MKIFVKSLIAVAVLALGAVPALAIDPPYNGTDNPGQTPPTGTNPPTNTGITNPSPNVPNDVLPSQARALGVKECQNFKTNFSDNKQAFGQCIKAVATALHNSSSPTTSSFGRTCRQAGLSAHRKPGQKRSDFSACVLAGTHAADVLEQQQSTPPAS